jgi:hypothetical protein
MGTRKEREPIRLGGHYMNVNGEVVKIDPLTTNLPGRCKVAIAEMTTGQPHVLILNEAVK